MWAYGQYFVIEKNDDRRMIFDYGVMVDFDQASHASTKDIYLIERKIKYVG